jgi:hypothetical protein
MTIEERIAQVASEPASAASDGQSATNHNLKDMMAWATWAKGQEATANPLGPRSGWGLLRQARAIPKGPTE